MRFPTPINQAVLLVLLILFSGCSYKSKNELATINELNESLESSNSLINISTATTMKDLEKKTTDPFSEERAAIWYPRAEQVVTLSKNIYDYIAELKRNNSYTPEEIKNLYHVQLRKYRDDLLNIDSSIRMEFANIPIGTMGTNTAEDKNENVYAIFFKNASAGASRALLTKFQNDIKKTENKITAFCNTKVSVNFCGFYVPFPIISQNSTILKKGEKLEITAGIASFDKTVKPVIVINSRNSGLIEEGLSHYSMTVKEAPGKYSIPVRISFKDPWTGRQEELSRRIEYTVIKECNQ